MDTKKYLYVRPNSCTITLGTLRVDRSSSILSNPVDKISNVKDATQNQTLVVKTRNRITPSEVIVNVVMLMLAETMGEPEVRNSIGIEIIAAKTGMSVVREKKCLSGILDETAKTIGIKQSMAKYDRLKMNREVTIIATIAIILAKGFIDCKRPFLLLKSSM